MANESTEYRREYADKADLYFRRLVNWLRDHIIEKLHIVYQGVDEPINTVLTRMRTTSSHDLEELIRLISSDLFAPEFADRLSGLSKIYSLATTDNRNSPSK